MLVCYILMIISFVAIVLNGLQGFLKFNIYNAGHIEFAFVSEVLFSSNTLELDCSFRFLKLKIL